MEKTIKEKVMQAWAQGLEVEIHTKGNFYTGNVTEFSGKDFELSCSGSAVELSQFPPFDYLDISNIRFVCEGIAKQQISKKLESGKQGDGWYIYDRNRCVGLGKYYSVARIDSDVPIELREAYAILFAEAPKLRDALKMVKHKGMMDITRIGADITVKLNDVDWQMIVAALEKVRE